MRVRIKAETRSFCPKKCGLRKGDLAEVVEEEYEPENLILGCLGGRFVGVYVPNPSSPARPSFYSALTWSLLMGHPRATNVKCRTCTCWMTNEGSMSCRFPHRPDIVDATMFMFMCPECNGIVTQGGVYGPEQRIPTDPGGDHGSQPVDAAPVQGD
jgi:hypothetical protein